MLLGSRLWSAVVAIILLVAGRRLYWLLVGLCGFLLGVHLVPLVAGITPHAVTLLIGLLAGLMAAVLAVFFQKVAIGLAGFLVGGYVVYWWIVPLAGEPAWWIWPVVIAAGLAGAFLTRLLFEIALVLLSSMLGATLALEALGGAQGLEGILFVLLVIGGIVLQTVTGRRRGSE